MPGPRLWKRYNGVYYIVLPGDRRITLKTRDKETATKLFHKYRKNWLSGKIELLEGAKSIRLGAFKKEYLKAREKKARSTYRNDKAALAHLVSYLGADRTLRSITPREAEKFKAGLLRGLSPITVNVYLRHLRAAFSTALRWEYVLKNPFRSVPFEEEPDRESPPVIEEVLAGILARADAEERRAVLLALYTGLRPFELVGLQYGIHVAGGFIRIRGKRGRLREIPLFGECKALIGEGDRGKPVLSRWRTASGLSHMVRRLADDAGYKNVRLYDLRHTAATVMTMAGLDPWAISKLMGHTDMKTTARYVRVTRQHLEVYLEKARGIYDKSMTAALPAPVSIGNRREKKRRASDS